MGILVLPGRLLAFGPEDDRFPTPDRALALSTYTSARTRERHIRLYTERHVVLYADTTGISRGSPGVATPGASSFWRLAETTAALAAHLDDALSVSFASDDFAEAGEAKQSLAVVAALCATVGRTVADAASRLHGIDPELPEFMPFGEG